MPRLESDARLHHNAVFTNGYWDIDKASQGIDAFIFFWLEQNDENALNASRTVSYPSLETFEGSTSTQFAKREK